MRKTSAILLAVFVLAFWVRLGWILGVQHPLEAIYSDMAGYVDRAERLLFHMPPPADPRISAIYPWGAHTLLALEFYVVGRHNAIGQAVLHAFVGAIPAPCMAALALRLVPSRALAALVGVAVALWYPQVAFTGFFLSEMWFSAAIAIHAVLTVREGRKPLGLLATGAMSALAIVVRPQFLMTWGLDVASRALSLLRRAGTRGVAWGVLWLSLPTAIAIGGSAIRLHSLAGHWGMISENEEMRLLFAQTDICELHSSWRAPNGEMMYYWFGLPSRPSSGPSNSLVFDGYISDPAILRNFRLDLTRGVTLKSRVLRTLGNIRILYTGNLPWPESNYKEPPWRYKLQTSSRDALLYGILPLAALGLALGRHNRTAWIAGANLGTSIFSAAVYFAEARYHVPYDPFAILLAAAGAHAVVTRVKRGVRISWRGLKFRTAGEPTP